MTKVDEFECSFCKGNTRKQVFSAFDFDDSVEPFNILQCATCGVAETSPKPDEVSLNDYYSSPYYGSGAKKFSGLVEFLTIAGNKSRAKKILKVLSSVRNRVEKPRVLDIGCGRATLLGQLNQLGCKCIGTELEKHPQEEDLPDIKIYRSSVEDIKFTDASFDVVIIWHVLEHLYQPSKTLDEVARITREGGIAAIAVPNFSSLQSRLFKANWFHLDLPRHLYHFNLDNLSNALIKRGYVIHSTSTCSLEQNLFGFIQSAMNSFRIFGKPNSFYQLLKQNSGLVKKLRLLLYLVLAGLIFPFALIEFIISCILKNGASVILFAQKSEQQFDKDGG
jgi:2-polyprenyl-3-methyl-5-hydroxy-6-metoxy-1,4-benzoquinol methylase